MNFTLVDVGEFLFAAAAGAAVLAAPGAALARLFGLVRGAKNTDLLNGIVAGLAVLPVLDSVVTRFLGLDAALAANIVLAIGAVGWAVRERKLAWPSQLGLLLVGGWLILVGIETVDFDIAGKLFQPLSIFDMVKHAATTQAIYDSGTPPRDAFFLRPERASYYYFFYTLCALIMRLCYGLVSAKAAFAGMAFWTGIAAYGLVRLAIERAGLDTGSSVRRQQILILAVMAAGGLDILAVLFFAVTRHYWVADPLQWNEQVGAWLEDILWVPHHVAALIAGVVALLALCNAIGDAGDRLPPRRIFNASLLLTGIAFASCLGLSVWVSFGFAATMVLWGILLLAERRWHGVATMVGAALVALVVALPQLFDLKTGRVAGGPFPVVPMVRAFAPVELLVSETWQPTANLILLPLNYIIEFGALALGTFVFWRQRWAGTVVGRSEFHRVLTIAAMAGLIVGALLRSTLFNNDLGWRVLLLPLLAGTVWTVTVVDRMFRRSTERSPIRPALCALLVTGWATVAYGAVLMRTYPFMTINPKARFIAANPETERALRSAFSWASQNLPHSAVLQQNPTFRRAFAFGVYGRNPVGVADAFASLYGADPKAVAARIDSIGPIFKAKLALSDIAARASTVGISDLVVTAADPIWAQPDSFVWRVKPAFSAPLVRIIPVHVLEAAR